MSIHFKSLRSSSSGNCLLVWTDRTSVLIDCGLGSMKRTREVLTKNLGDQLDIDAVVVSHMHTDHIGYYSLRVLDSLGVKVKMHESCLPQLKDKHFNGRRFKSLKLRRPIYSKTAAYGHFGRKEPGFTWEQTPKARILKKGTR